MKANLLDNGIGDTLVSPAFDDVTLISRGRAQIMDPKDPAEAPGARGKHNLSFDDGEPLPQGRTQRAGLRARRRPRHRRRR